MQSNLFKNAEQNKANTYGLERDEEGWKLMMGKTMVAMHF